MFTGRFLGVKLFISDILDLITYFVYWVYIYLRIPIIRRKKKIKVLFVLQELGAWKTELLYLAMFKHPRFEPSIIVTEFKNQPMEKDILMAYLVNKGYEYYDYEQEPDAFDKVNADFVFYYKPYLGMYPKGTYFTSRRKTIPLSINYGFTITELPQHIYRMIHVYSYRFFVETKEVIDSQRKQLGFKTHNMRVTGTPMQDVLLQDRALFLDPWKDRQGKKRIIYAPHHSISGTNSQGIEYATILLFGEYLLELAEKYKEQITIAFKPHSALHPKLLQIWGEEKTSVFYKKWETLDNTQLELGDYIGLFKYSDAMIHDCSSFIVEYQFMDKPTLFLTMDDGNYVESTLNKFGQDAYHCHSIAQNKEQIEKFVLEVIKGVDDNKKKREYLKKQYLLPPNGKAACENIIDAILG